MKNIIVALIIALLIIPNALAIGLDTCLLKGQDNIKYYMEFNQGFSFSNVIKNSEKFCNNLDNIDNVYTEWYPNQNHIEAINDHNDKNPSDSWNLEETQNFFSNFENVEVPEFSTSAALIALIGSVAVFMIIRKKNR